MKPGAARAHIKLASWFLHTHREDAKIANTSFGDLLTVTRVTKPLVA